MSVSQAYYDRPFVAKIQDIFDHPQPPDKVVQKQFDGFDEELRKMAQKAWHEIDRRDWGYYGMDLAYVPLQSDLFDYLFPAFLIGWREGLENRKDWLTGEREFYSAVGEKQVLEQMVSAQRRDACFAWMIDGFLEAVDSIRLEEIVESRGCNDNLHYFLGVFNGLGQSVCLFESLLERLLSMATPGRGRFWLTFAAGFSWPVDQVPWVKPWNATEGGGGIYLFHTHADYLQGFLPKNQETLRANLSINMLKGLLYGARRLNVQAEEVEMIDQCLERMESYPKQVQAKLDWYLDSLSCSGNDALLEPSFFD